ncbi:hypothetical protein M9H77_31806 [Catharanthus roseus]|uniref:Uncharacterized protein n=1 Tax=Catharanthus roseus TaxID=4058 RepID=A0ACC0A212_CATRO|nr:hypothetical protein M9H77_31806 [Catharanthus roseus]
MTSAEHLPSYFPFLGSLSPVVNDKIKLFYVIPFVPELGLGHSFHATDGDAVSPTLKQAQLAGPPTCTPNSGPCKGLSTLISFKANWYGYGISSHNIFEDSNLVLGLGNGKMEQDLS